MEEKGVMESTNQAWEDSYFSTWEMPPATTATAMGEANIDAEDSADTAEFGRRSFTGVTVLVHFEPGSAKPNLAYPHEGKKFLWRQAVSSGFVYTPSMNPVIACLALEDDLGFPVETIGSVSPWPLFWRYDQPEPPDARGVFPTNYRRKVLFTKKVRLRISELPRWKPKTIIGLREFEEEDV